MFWLFNETKSRLDSLSLRAKEAKDLPYALEFSRYILNSRLCDLLDSYASQGPLPCDGKLIRRKAEELQRLVCLRYEKNDSKPHVEASDLEQIRAELGELKRLMGASSTKPEIKVISGGLDTDYGT